MNDERIKFRAGDVVKLKCGSVAFVCRDDEKDGSVYVAYYDDKTATVKFQHLQISLVCLETQKDGR